MTTPSCKPPATELAPLEEAVGYLNFSSGASDPKFLRNVNRIYRAIESHCDDKQRAIAILCVWLEERMKQLSAS